MTLSKGLFWFVMLYSHHLEFLMIVSDHGMTEGGNHGGSSYEETDSLALFVSAKEFSDSRSSKETYQVDIAPTLALLFGVPIPKNNIGTVMSEVFASLEDEKLLRILELNSWQLLRLLQTQLNEFECWRFSCESGRDQNDVAERLCCFYMEATTHHESWKSEISSSLLDRASHGGHYGSAVLAYQDFLRIANKWLSSKSTDKPVGLLLLGIGAMFLSCLGLMSLLSLFVQEVHFMESHHLSNTNNLTQKWQLEDNFTVAVIISLVLSMASTSMIEEEQYIWHFLSSSLYLILLRKSVFSMINGGTLNLTPEYRARRSRDIYLIIAVLISGRILRGWHQGGVNWTYLPDISKWLQQAGQIHIKTLQLTSTFLVFILCVAGLLALQLRKHASLLVLIYLFPMLIILMQNLRFQDYTITSFGTGNTTMIQIVYAFTGTSTLVISAATPWLMPLQNPEADGVVSMLRGFRDSLYVIGWSCIFSWCLLQMLLQQPINSMPVSLILVQILSSVCYFSDGSGDLHLKQWVKVAALYYLGMAGHFALGNTNTLATIDVAGAYIGISSHSTIISGILMFMITYASPMLALLSMLLNVSMRNMRAVSNSQDVDIGQILKLTLGFPCLVPLGINSTILLAYTIMLLLMRSHLFIWSVFSPKYLYVCATTVCVYIGVSVVTLAGAYTCIVFNIRRNFNGN